jgi:UDP-N-acetyl-D-galactosamine dehydrogenase
MSNYVAETAINLMLGKEINILDSRILILGFSFKENCPDYRNTKVKDLYDAFVKSGCIVDVFDPQVNQDDVRKDYEIQLISEPGEGIYDAVILAVAHNEFLELKKEINNYCKEKNVIFDLKHVLDSEITDGRL